MNSKLTRDDCIKLLCDLANHLNDIGEKRLPKRSDFSDRDVVAIKAFLGPWPRALEAAGLKESRNDGKAEKLLEKRIRIKKLKTQTKIQNIKSKEQKK